MQTVKVRAGGQGGVWASCPGTCRRAPGFVSVTNLIQLDFLSFSHFSRTVKSGYFGFLTNPVFTLIHVSTVSSGDL